MAHPHLASTLARFTSRMHQTKNRLLSIPAEVQRELGLERREENDLILVSIRRGGAGRWNHHYFKLTFDNEFAIPSDVTAIAPGDDVEVKIHEIYAGTPRARSAGPKGAELLLSLVEALPGDGWRESGSTDLDDVLASELDDDRLR